MPKIEPSASENILIDNKPYNRGNLDLLVNSDYTQAAIYHVRDNKSVVEYTDIGDYTDTNDNSFASYQDFLDYLDPFFFRRVGTGSDGFGISRVVFYENFTGDGISTTFQLNGTIQNATFDSGVWSDSRIVNALPSNIVRTDNFKPTYDGVPNFLNNRIFVTSISPTGLVTLTHPPRTGINISIFYWYDLRNGDRIPDYYRPEIVASMEADNTRLDNKLDAHIGDTSNPHGTDDDNLPTNYVPSNYTPTNAFLSGDLEGIDNALASITPNFNLDEQTFDVSTDSLPITTVATTTKLNVDFENFDKNLDLTGQLPINMSIGSTVTLRKKETNQYRLSYNDGTIGYSFINRKGDYLVLVWSGNKYVV